MEQKHYQIVGIGEILWDLLPEGRQIGGAPANFAYHAQSLGGKGIVVSAVGDDDYGHELKQKVVQAGLDPTFLAIDKHHPTGTVTVQLDDAGIPDFEIHENVAWDHIPFSEDLKALAEQTDAVCFGSLAQRSTISMKTIIAFLDLLPADCVKVFDVNLRQTFYNEQIIKASLSRSNIVKLNEDELPVVANICDVTGSEIDALTSLLELNDLDLIVLTKGSHGSILVSPEDHSILNAPSVDVADTVGAGDAFTAAVVLGLIRNLPLGVIHRNATMLSAYVCTQRGAMPVLSDALIKELIIDL
jgi:fructokinase